MHILCIVNPASGQEYPILSALNTFFEEHDIDWDICITGKHDFPEKSYDYYVIYGGDGTVAEYLGKGAMPALILHGGTGNIMARDLNIPVDPKDALTLLLEPKIKNYDAYEVNGTRRYCRMFCGPHAEELSKVTREDKNEKGIGAYIEAIFKGIEMTPRQFDCTIDGQKEALEAYVLLITNFAQVGLGRMEIDGCIDPQDGKLDIVRTTSPIIPFKETRPCQTIEIHHTEPTMWAVDDDFEEYTEVRVQVEPGVLKLLTP